MLRYIGRRVGFLVVALLAVSIITFALMHSAPGNFSDIQKINLAALGADQAAMQQVQDEVNRRYGLDRPLWQQYLTYMEGAVQWKFGPSFAYPNVNIETIIARAFPISLTLAVLAVLLSVLIAIPLGVMAAVKQNSWVDHVSMFVSMLGHALPSYVLAVFLILLFVVDMKWLPLSGWNEPKHIVLPLLAMSLGPVAGIARYMRTSLVEALRQDYVRAAWARGGNFRRVVLFHALRNSLIPLVTVLGPQVARLMVGTVFIESMFRIPGLGQYFAAAASLRDYPLLMTSTLFFAFIVMAMNLIVDLTYGLLDPRIRYD